MKNSLRESGQFLSHYIGPMWHNVLLLTLLVVTGISLTLINPQIVRFFIDSVQTARPLDELVRAGVWFILLALIQQVISILSVYMSENIGWSTTNILRADLVDHCLRLDMTFHNRHTPGEMIERIDGDVTTLANLFSQFIIQIVANGLLLVGILVLMFLVDWHAGAAISLFTLITMYMVGRVRNIAVPHWTEERKASASLYGYIEERLSGMEDIRANNGKPYVMRHFFRLAREVYRHTQKSALMTNYMVNTSWVLFSIGIAVSLAVSAWLYFQGSITMGGAYIVFFYTNLLRMPIDQIMRQMQDLQRGSASLARVRQLLDEKTRVQDALTEPAQASTERLLSGPLGVTFEQVNFAYHDEPDGNDSTGQTAAPLVLKDVSFRLEPGQVLGLLGRTGSGKTTLARLLFRFYDPDSGSICFEDGQPPVDLRAIPFEELWQRTGMVTQNIQLFHASIRDNLTFFDDSIPDERILQVIDNLGLSPWLHSMPDGLDSELASGGASLSAGEAQLLAFTRIFLKDPGLVILDEATSRLDPATETLIERAVDRLVQGRTAIIIAHRLGTVERADQVLILEEGEVLEYGARTQLAADPRSRFYHLLQTGLEEVLA